MSGLIVSKSRRLCQYSHGQLSATLLSVSRAIKIIMTSRPQVHTTTSICSNNSKACYVASTYDRCQWYSNIWYWACWPGLVSDIGGGGFKLDIPISDIGFLALGLAASSCTSSRATPRQKPPLLKTNSISFAAALPYGR